MSPSQQETDDRVLLERVTTVLEYLQAGHADHEERIRAHDVELYALKARSVITPKQALAFTVSIATIAGVVVIPFVAK